MVVELKPHQKQALSRLGNGKILNGGTGSGKTITSLAYYVEHEAPKPIYVITTAKKRNDLDWEGEAVKFGIGRKESLYGTITVDSWNNIKKYVDVEDAFFILDEQKIVGTGAWTKSFFKIAKKNRWILLSATPGDTWLDYMPVFIANGFYKGITEFKREHVIYNNYANFPKVDRYVQVNKLVRLRHQLLIDMPYEKHTTRHPEWIECDYDKELLEKVVKQRWHVYEERPLRNVAELFLVMRKVVNSDPGRLKSLETLIAKHPKLIVFYNFDYELEILRTLGQPSSSTVSKSQNTDSMRSEEDCVLGEIETPPWKECSESCPGCQMNSGGTETPLSLRKPSERLLETRSDVIIAEWNGHKHEPVPTGDRWVYLVNYRAGAEGWNCVTTDAMVFYSLTYSYKDFVQAHGRIDRLNTPFKDLKYKYLVSDSIIDRAIKKCLSEKRSFNESGFLKEVNLVA